MRAAITIITAIPILVVYPFLQRYFVTGLTLGGVKG
jgi:putative aldouronate transport system permease protein